VEVTFNSHSEYLSYILPQMLTVDQILTNQLKQAKTLIEAKFDSLAITAVGIQQLQALFQKNCQNWGLFPGFSFTKFRHFMLKHSKLREITLKSDDYGNKTRYVWRNPSVPAIALSLKSNSYLSHETAVFLHGLKDSSAERVYVNREQSPKPKGSGLSQESLNRAFANKQRESKLSYTYHKSQIVLLNGMSTNRLGVEQKRSLEGEVLDLTSLERTLIDITVRPNYAGGVNAVLDTYKKARTRLSVDRVLNILKRLDYVYPYHQAIGFYLEKAGYNKRDWTRFLKLGTSFKFYLTHALPSDKEYDSTWSLFYPRNLNLIESS
jgi:predicted transcriptional regulator of viral defense system